MSLNYFYSILYIHMLNELQAYVVAIYPEVVKKTKTGEDFPTQRILVEWDRDAEFPSRLVLEQSWAKKVEVAKSLKEWSEYIFKLNWRANEWTDPNGNKTAFGSISAWKAEEVIDNTQNVNNATDLPF